MIERKTQIITYYPRSHFWKFWEKRPILAILTETDKRVTSKNFYPDGALRRNYIRWKMATLWNKFSIQMEHTKK